MPTLVCRHPLVQDRLARLRDRSTPGPRFKRLLAEAARLLGCFALEGVRASKTKVRTPLGASSSAVLGEELVFVAILRAGLGMLEGLLDLAPEARVGHIGLYRNEDTLDPVRYYVRLPKDLDQAYVVLADPMLATGGSALEAIDILKSHGARRIVFLCLIAAREGLRRIRRAHPDVSIVTAGVDSRLNRKGYIVPGLGDAGDRLFGT